MLPRYVVLGASFHPFFCCAVLCCTHLHLRLNLLDLFCFSLVCCPLRIFSATRWPRTRSRSWNAATSFASKQLYAVVASIAALRTPRSRIHDSPHILFLLSLSTLSPSPSPSPSFFPSLSLPLSLFAHILGSASLKVWNIQVCAQSVIYLRSRVTSRPTSGYVVSISAKGAIFYMSVHFVLCLSPSCHICLLSFCLCHHANAWSPMRIALRFHGFVLFIPSLAVLAMSFLLQSLEARSVSHLSPCYNSAIGGWTYTIRGRD